MPVDVFSNGSPSASSTRMPTASAHSTERHGPDRPRPRTETPSATRQDGNRNRDADEQRRRQLPTQRIISPVSAAALAASRTRALETALVHEHRLIATAVRNSARLQGLATLGSIFDAGEIARFETAPALITPRSNGVLSEPRVPTLVARTPSCTSATSPPILMTVPLTFLIADR